MNKITEHSDYNKNDFIAHYRENDGTPQYLWQHLNETSILAGEFTSKIGLREHGELVGLLHDLGKATSEFNSYIKSATGLIEPDDAGYVDAQKEKGKIDHSSAGAQFIYRYFSSKDIDSKLTSQILSLIIASHHSGLIDCITPDGKDTYTKRMCKPEDWTHITEAERNLSNDIKDRINILLSDTSLADKINQKIKSLYEDNDDDNETFLLKIALFIRFIFSCLIDADRCNTIDFEFPSNESIRNNGKYAPWPVLIERLENKLKEFKNENRVDSLRKEISDNCLNFSVKPKGLYQLTVPTGGGKTLSSLRFALNHANKYKMDRIIYVIPYTSIIDQNAQKTREILEEPGSSKYLSGSIVLEHQSNLTPEKETIKQRLLSEDWDAPIVYTTMVQFLEALFGRGTRSARRMHQLANSVIIFDEIQTIPIKCVQLFNAAVRFFIKGCGSTVILCTATQPLLDIIKPIERALKITPAQQIMPDVQKLFKELKRVNVFDKRKIGGWSDPEIADMVNEELKRTGSTLIIVNTKASALNLYKEIKNTQDAAVYHLSTYMCPAHRMEILDKVHNCLKDKKPVICISTQLIEAGVDIDFGSVIRYLAGIDSIAQAAGRCNRNGSMNEPGRVFIINPALESIDKLTDIKIGIDNAQRVLNEFIENPLQFGGDILSPEAVKRYYQYYFYNRLDEMSYRVKSSSIIGRDDNLFELLSRNALSVSEYKRINHSNPPSIPLRQSFMSASEVFQSIDSLTRGVIVQYKNGKRITTDLCSSIHIEQQYRLMREAQRYSVNVFSNVFSKLVDLGVIHETQNGTGIYYVNEQYYSEQFGLDLTQVNSMDILIS